MGAESWFACLGDCGLVRYTYAGSERTLGVERSAMSVRRACDNLPDLCDRWDVHVGAPRRKQGRPAKVLLVLLLCLLPVPAMALQSVTIGWSDTLPAGAGVRVYWGRHSGIYGESRDFPNAVSQVTVADLPEGMWRLVATVYDSAGRESGFSNEIVRDDVVAPTKPQNLSVKE